MNQINDELKNSIKLYLCNLPIEELLFMHQIITDELYLRRGECEDLLCE